MFCIKCGKEINSDTVFCPNCGQKQTQNNSSTGAQVPANPSPVSLPPNTQQQVSQNQPYNTYPAPKPRKKRGCLTALIIAIIVLALAAAGIYFFVPGLIQPFDLGVRSTEKEYTSIMTKLGISKDKAPAEGNADDYIIVYGAPQAVETSMTSAEITAFLTENRPPYYAVKNVQFAVNDDGSVEASGQIDTGYVFREMLNGQYSKEDAKIALPMLGLLPDKVNVYMKIYGSVEDNQIQGLGIESVKVAGIPIPESVLNSSEQFIVDTLNSYIEKVCAKSGANIEHLGVDNGNIDFKGSLPSSIQREFIG